MARKGRKRKKPSSTRKKEGDGETTPNSVFRVLMSVEPAVILGEKKTIKMDWGEIRFENALHQKMKVPKGLNIIATLALPTDDIKTAISRARGLSNRILSLFSFLTNASLPELLIVKAYDITPKKKTGEFVQYDYDIPLETRSARVVDKAELKRCTTSISKLSESDNNAVLRAMHWYRLALQSKDVLERFTSLWIGLETINSILRDHYGLEMEYAKCAKCGHESTPILNGVKRLLSAVSGETRIWRRVRKLRAGTIHGFRALMEITPESKKLVPLLETALGNGLNLILGLKQSSVNEPLDLGHHHPAYYSTTAIIEGQDLQLLDIEITPTFNFELKIFEPQPNFQQHQFRARQEIDQRYQFKEIVHAFHAMPQVAQKAEFTPLPESQEEE